MEQSVVRLTHCGRQIFCLRVPDCCPACGQQLAGSRLQQAPVSLPSPLENGHRTPCCLLVAPAQQGGGGGQGGSDRDFDGTSELHTGISSTTGVVYNYTRGGVVRDRSGWELCVCVPLVRSDMFPLLAQWDQYLDRFSSGPQWDPAWHSFHEEDHNCFSFCLDFLNGVLAAEGRGALSRDALTRCFILPRMRRVSGYQRLCKHLQNHPFYLVDQDQDQDRDQGKDQDQDQGQGQDQDQKAP
ncbi:MKRN2 opposite strand protein-like [Menidia menidia]